MEGKILLRRPSVWIKTALGLVIAAFIMWLALARLSDDQRFATLEELFRSQHIGQVSDEDAERFRSLVTEAVVAAQIKETMVINSVPERGRLHFFVTDPPVKWFTQCDEGNAVYDADLEAV